MRVFVYEYLCGGALLGQSVPASLRTEGWAMVSAALADLAGCPGVEVVTLLEPQFLAPARSLAPNLIALAGSADQEEASFRTQARACEFALIIAPEGDDVLFHRCRWAEEEGSRLLGPSSAAVRLTADKLDLARHLVNARVPTPPTVPFSLNPPFPWPLVVKPREGAGSQATYLVASAEELAGCPTQARSDGWTGDLIVQPWVAGQAVSVALLAGPGGLHPLPACQQWLEPDDQFRYRGGSVPLAAELDDRARALAVRAARTVPGLAGYLGVDLVLGSSAEHDRVIEINPRLTTSYVGLRAHAGFNLAGALLDVVRGRPVTLGPWGKPVSFRADGGVTAP